VRWNIGVQRGARIGPSHRLGVHPPDFFSRHSVQLLKNDSNSAVTASGCSSATKCPASSMMTCLTTLPAKASTKRACAVPNDALPETDRSGARACRLGSVLERHLQHCKLRDRNSPQRMGPGRFRRRRAGQVLCHSLLVTMTGRAAASEIPRTVAEQASEMPPPPDCQASLSSPCPLRSNGAIVLLRKPPRLLRSSEHNPEPKKRPVPRPPTAGPLAIAAHPEQRWGENRVPRSTRQSGHKPDCPSGARKERTARPSARPEKS
jgi:hypothetical protein